jgi:hypothetical protein
MASQARAPIGAGRRREAGADVDKRVPSHQSNIARARELLAASKAEGQPTEAAVDHGKPDCPCCGGRMIIIEVFERGATPRYRPTAPTIVSRLDTS